MKRGEGCRKKIGHPGLKGTAKEPRKEWSENHRGRQ